MEKQILMKLSLDEFKHIIQNETNGEKGLSCEIEVLEDCTTISKFEIKVVDKKNPKTFSFGNKSKDKRDVIQILSDYFETTVNSWKAVLDENRIPFIEIYITPLYTFKTLSIEEIKNMMKLHNRVYGLVSLPLDALIDNRKNVIETLSLKLTNTKLLDDICYKPLDVVHDEIIIQVSGDASTLLKMM